MQQINILFLGGAKRVAIARMFKKAAARMGYDCRIFSYEMGADEAIACEATIIEGLRWSDPQCDAHLRQIVAEHSIKAVIPFVDGAVAVAARLADVTFVPSCEPELAADMFDKVKAATMFEAAAIPVPATYHPGQPSLRLIAKPANGSASKGIVAIRSLQQLDEFLALGDEYLIQERIDNRREYSVDCYVDVFTGRILAACPRQRLQVSGGEVVKTATVDKPELVDLSAKTIESLSLRGALTLQFIEDLDDGRILLMEINPRLGGGAVCSVEAGADIPQLILSQALDMEAAPVEWRPGVEIARYLDHVTFYN